MQKINPIYLTEDDVKKLLPNEVGRGSDGMVFKYNKEYLIKLYHNKLRFMKSKITDVNILKTFFYEPITYYDEENVKLRSSSAIDMTINRQKEVKRTHLPKAPVYINNRFSGYLIKRLSGVQIHKLSGMPLMYKKAIIEEVLKSVDELFKNYIYHIDLANSPITKSLHINSRGEIESVGHSNILVNPLTLRTNIIDLDGKSTVYTEQKSEAYERKSMYGFCVLILEFLFNIDFEEYEENIEELFNLLEKKGIFKEFIEPLGCCELDIEQAKNFVKTIGKKQY